MGIYGLKFHVIDICVKKLRPLLLRNRGALAWWKKMRFIFHETELAGIRYYKQICEEHKKQRQNIIDDVRIRLKFIKNGGAHPTQLTWEAWKITSFHQWSHHHSSKKRRTSQLKSKQKLLTNKTKTTTTTTRTTKSTTATAVTQADRAAITFARKNSFST